MSSPPYCSGLTVDNDPKVYETGKMRVEVGSVRVVKKFKNRRDAKKRYVREKTSLQLLSELDGTPDLLDFNDEKNILVMNRLSGESTTTYSEENIRCLTYIIEQCLSLGVAPHTLHDRDILVDASGVSLVDFERVSIRTFKYSPIWKIAKLVPRFHLYRLIYNNHPILLTSSQVKFLNLGNSIRRLLTPMKNALRPFRSWWRNR